MEDNSGWILKIKNAGKSDEGTYDCQMNTNPPQSLQFHLSVLGKLNV